MLFRKKAILKFCALLSLVSLWSCSEEFSDTIKSPSNQDHLVTLENAIGFASVLEFQVASSNPNGRSKDGQPPIANKTVDESFSILDINDQPALHIVNYEEGGYVVISGDDRLSPVQAYVENGSLTLETEELPDGLIMWLSETTEFVKKTRNDTDTKNAAVVQSFDPCDTRALTSQNTEPCPEDCLRNSFAKVDPLLSTKWGQGVNYNDAAPYMGCTDYINGRAPAGCVATAIGQVMKYHGFPNTYNWAGMPNIGGGTLISTLLGDIGNFVNMNYGCSGSGAYTSDAPYVLKNFYGYQSASFADWQFHTVKTNLNAGRPVILAAGRTENCFLVWCIATNGHAWVVDGYIENEIWDAACQSGTVHVTLSMNWGWAGEHNGWFTYSNWDPGDVNYQYNKKMVYNIYP